MVVLKRIKRSVVVSDCDDSQSKRSKNDCDEGRKVERMMSNMDQFDACRQQCFAHNHITRNDSMN